MPAGPSPLVRIACGTPLFLAFHIYALPAPAANEAPPPTPGWILDAGNPTGRSLYSLLESRARSLPPNSEELPDIAGRAMALLAEDDPRQLEWRAALLEWHRQHNMADELLDRWHEECRTSRQADFLILVAEGLRVLGRPGDPTRADELLARAHLLDPGKIDPPRQLALAAWDSGNWEGTRRWAGRWREVDPADPQPTLLLAMIEAREGKLGEASGRIRALLSSDASAATRRKVREFYEDFGLPEEEIALLSTSVSRDPVDWRTALDLAGLLARNGRKDDAVKILTEVPYRALPVEHRDLFLQRSADFAARTTPGGEAAIFARRGIEASASDLPALCRFAALLAASGRREEAAGHVKEAILNARPDDGRYFAETFLIDLLSQLPASSAAVDSGARLADAIPSQTPASPALQEWLSQLEDRVGTIGGENDFLLATRAFLRARRLGMAEQILASGLAAFSDSAPLRELRLDLALARGDRQAALEAASRLADIDIPNRRTRLLKLASLHVQSGNVSEGIGILRELLDSDPRDAGAKRELASALEAGDEWFAAVEVWTDILSGDLPPGELAKVLAAARPAFLRVGKAESFDRLEARLSPPQGGDQEAGSPPITGVERETAPHESDGLARPSEWVSRIRGENDPSLRAGLLRKALDRFPRSVGLLDAAAEEAARAMDIAGAAEFLRRASVIEPANPRRALRLAGLLLEQGERVAALEEFERAFRNAPPEAPPGFLDWVEIDSAQARDAVLAAARVRSKSGAAIGLWTPLPEGRGISDDGIGQAAIEAISRLVAGTPSAAKWKREWRLLKHPASRIRALACMGERKEALSGLENHLAANPSDFSAARFYFEVCLDWDEVPRAMHFIDGAPGTMPELADLFLTAIARRCAGGPFDRVESLEAGLDGSTTAAGLRWPVAQLLSSVGEYRAALRLGMPALESMDGSKRETARMDLTGWSLAIADLTTARSLLAPIYHKPSTATCGPGDRSAGWEAFDSPEAGLDRLRFLLASADERDRLLANSREEGSSPGSGGRALLFEAMAGDAPSSAADQWVRHLSDTRAASGGAPLFAADIRTALNTLLSWGLHPAAIAVASSAISDDNALRRLRGQVNDDFEREWNFLAICAEMDRMEGGALQRRLDSFGTGSGARATLIELARQLEQMENPQAAMECFLRAFSISDEDGEAFRGAFRSAQAAGDRDVLFQLATDALASPKPGLDAPSASLVAAAIQISALDFSGARRTVLDGLAVDPDNANLLQRLAALDVIDGNIASAIEIHEALWKDGEGDAVSGEFLARLCIENGKRELFERTIVRMLDTRPEIFQAFWDGLRIALGPGETFRRACLWLVPLLEQNGGGAHEPALVTALIKSGNVEAAVTRIRRIEEPTTSLAACSAALETGAREHALIEVCAEISRRELRHPGASKIAALSLLKSLALAGAEDSLAADILRAQADSGDGAAEEILIQLLIASESPGTEDLIAEFLRGDRFAPGALRGLASLLAGKGSHRQAAAVFERLAHDEPHIADWRFHAAEQLRMAGDTAGARSLLQPLADISALQPDLRVQVAEELLALGEVREASQRFVECVSDGPARLRRRAYIGMAAAALAEGRHSDAEHALEMAAANRGAGNIARACLDFYRTTGQLLSLDPHSAGANLSAVERAELRALIIRELSESGNEEAAARWLAEFPIYRKRNAAREEEVSGLPSE